MFRPFLIRPSSGWIQLSMFILLYSKWASTRRPRKFGSISRTQHGIFSPPKSSHSAWKLSSLKSNWLRGIFTRNKAQGLNLTVHIHVVTMLRMFTATHITLNDFLARTETTLLTGKPNTSWVKNGYYFMTCITCKLYTKQRYICRCACYEHMYSGSSNIRKSK